MQGEHIAASQVLLAWRKLPQTRTPEMTANPFAKQRQILADLFDIAIRAADPKGAVIAALKDNPTLARTSDKVHILALGKAAIPMIEAVRDQLANRQTGQELAITNYENTPENVAFRVLGAGHPVPDANGLAAGVEAVALLEQAGPGEQVIVLISGGGSALLPCPLDGVSLQQKADVTTFLLKCGADILEINEVRRALSKLKGGGMVALAAPAQISALILSDVPGDDLASVASGPTVTGSTNVKAAMAILDKYQLRQKVSPAIRTALALPHQPIAEQAQNYLIGSNPISVAATLEAAQQFGTVLHLCAWLDGDVREATMVLVDALEKADENTLIICGGETTVQVAGSGIGGRNQELALRVALEAKRRKLPENWLMLSGGTDGRDGPCDAAGAITDPQTLARMTAANIDAEAMLANSDSYHALLASDDLIFTGGTGTNVADIQIVWKL